LEESPRMARTDLVSSRETGAHQGSHASYTDVLEVMF
jgi:hypothetical protein